MVYRRSVLGGLAGLTLAGCGSRRQPLPPAPSLTQAPAFTPSTVPASWQPSVAGLDAVIDISHNVTVSDFTQVRQSNILGVIHKTSEGGDWFDPSYAPRR
ncbi:MAG: 1,4-beta-N-acetylmuramidase, partial [Reyranellales bacterium]